MHLYSPTIPCDSISSAFQSAFKGNLGACFTIQLKSQSIHQNQVIPPFLPRSLIITGKFFLVVGVTKDSNMSQLLLAKMPQMTITHSQFDFLRPQE